MIRCAWLLCLGACWTRAAADPAPPVRGAVLVDERAAWRWQVVTAPRLGVPALPPAGWPHSVGEAAAAAIAAPADGERITAAFGVTAFSLGPADEGYAMLELRLRYEDGVAVWLNGVEIVRQALPRGGTGVLAARPRGPEWETFYVPVAPGLLRASNTLAVEVHPSRRRLGPVLAAQLVGRRDRGIVRGPILVDAGATTATIAVETDPGVEAVLEWGPETPASAALPHRMTTPAGRRHAFSLTGLAPNRAIAYRVTAGATTSARTVFHTMPPPDAVVRIGIYGDVRGGHAIHKQLVDRMLREGLDFIAVTGDMVLRGSDGGDWQRFFAVTAELLAQLPYFPAVGNHDRGWAGADRATNADHAFSLPAGPPDRPAGAYWYSRDVADLHLVFLDSNVYDRVEQEAWLDADLAAARARGVRAILAFTHDGPYSRGYHGGNAIARARYAPILTRHRVDLLFAGHDHIYQRGERGGLRYVVTGGGGAPLYNFRCGVAGRPACPADDGVAAIAREHHYAVLTVARDLELCVRRADGTLVERCVRYRLNR